MKRLEKLETKIIEILKTNKEARNDDMYLYNLYVLDKEVNFERVFCDSEYRNRNNISNYASVERCRRKIQAKYPELKGTNDIYKQEEQIEYIEYSRS